MVPFASWGFTFSALFCLLRLNVDIESAGRGAALIPALFSGERDSAMPLSVLVRSEALRERRNVAPMSPPSDEMLCRDACLRRGGVEGNLGRASDWWFGGVGLLEPVAVAVGFGSLLCLWLPKKEGRLLKSPWDWDEVESVGGTDGSNMVQGSCGREQCAMGTCSRDGATGGVNVKMYKVTADGRKGIREWECG